MSTDRELLGLAAKALGYPVHTDDTIPRGLHVFYLEGKEWNPLIFDGDALRLAVRLNLLVMPYPDDRAVLVVEFKKNADPVNAIVSWGAPPDALAATRRAIVRAAAEIGRGMP